jgi:hypothetical protein
LISIVCGGCVPDNTAEDISWAFGSGGKEHAAFGDGGLHCSDGGRA